MKFSNICYSLVGAIVLTICGAIAYHVETAEPFVDQYEWCRSYAIDEGDTAMYHRCQRALDGVKDATQKYNIQSGSVEDICFKNAVRYAWDWKIQDCLDGDNPK